MKPLGLLVAFAGYTLAYFGWASLRGPGVGFLDLLVPGREPGFLSSTQPLPQLGAKPLAPNYPAVAGYGGTSGYGSSDAGFAGAGGAIRRYR